MNSIRSVIKNSSILASRPQIVQKEIDGRMTPIEEFFITDLIEFMVGDGLPVGYVVSEDETEAMGIDDRSALKRAQSLFGNLKQGALGPPQLIRQ